MCLAHSTFTLGSLQQPCPSFFEYQYKTPDFATDLSKTLLLYALISTPEDSVHVQCAYIVLDRRRGISIDQSKSLPVWVKSGQLTISIDAGAVITE